MQNLISFVQESNQKIDTANQNILKAEEHISEAT